MKYLFDENVIKWSNLKQEDLIDNVWWDVLVLDNPFDCYFILHIVKTDIQEAIFPLKDSSRFVFTTHFPRNRNVQQFDICTIEEGLALWADSIKYLNRQQHKILLK